VEEAGLAFVGPASATIEALGDKLNARRLAASVDVPSVPGTLERAPVDRPDQVADIIATAQQIGFPLLVKAAAGGGGRGMRRVARAEDLPAALVSGSREAASAFGDGSVYLEREILPARHIEVQLLGDAHGQVVALGERDCSLQRRHQKLVEEAPAPGLTEAQRRHLHGLAIRLGQAANLRSAATCEFLHDPGGSFWFLEVNTRLQVEHGVTELVAGVDIVREQFRIAAGAHLSPEAIAAGERAAIPASHAIEARISAEDPARAFAPTPGRVGRWVMASGPGVRVDTGIEAGDRVPPEYDNLIAKLMVQAPDRDAAIDRLARALDETEVGGVQTTLPFHRLVARSDAFRRGELSTGWVDEHWDGEAARAEAVHKALLAAGLEAIADDPGAPGPGVASGVPAGAAASPSSLGGRNGWRHGSRADGVDRWPS
jgi:acetyl/propionyl-CoA carboxylase alpha subunit